MAVIDVINQKGEVVGQYDLNDAIFAIEPHKDAIYEAVKMQQAGKRQGTHSTKVAVKFPAVAANLTVRKEPDVLVRVPSALRSSVEVERYSVRNLVTILTVLIRKSVAWL